MVWSKQS